MATRDELLGELEGDGDAYFESGRQNNLTDLALSMSAILTSLAATVLATTEVPRWVAAAVAAMPAASASLQRVIDFRGRASWYFEHAARVRAMAASLKYAPNPDLHEFARKRGELEVDMEQRWSQVTRPGVTPRARRGKNEA